MQNTQMKQIYFLFLVLFTFLLFSQEGSAQQNSPEKTNASPSTIKVVYHLTQGIEQAQSALRYIRNQLTDVPDTHIEVVAHASGIYFLLKDAKTIKGEELEPLITSLMQKGVVFKVCERTVQTQQLNHAAFLPGVVFVPSGIVEVTRLQHEGFAYIRP